MAPRDGIPNFTLFGETGPFPDVVHCEALATRAPSHDWRISAHRHVQMAQVFVIASGRMTARIDGAEADLTAGMFVYVPAQTVHAFVFEPQTEGMVFSLPVNVLGTIGPAGGQILPALSRPVIGAASGRLRAIADLLFGAGKGQDAGLFRAQQLVGLAHAMLAVIAEAGHRPEPEGRAPARARLRRLDRLIGQHMADGWGAAEYAAALSISLGHLSRLCRDAKGMGTAAYIEQAVMEEACRLLAFTQLPVSEVGYRLGFGDPSYFSRRFRSLRGLTPTAYRAQFLGTGVSAAGPGSAPDRENRSHAR